MRYFFDTEFIEDGKTIELISIALVAEDGRELYCCNSECKLDRANDWVKQHVLPHLPKRQSYGWASPHPYGTSIPPWMSRQDIKEAVLKFAPPESKPHFWAYFADYDWVVFCQLFGKMVDLPQGYSMFCRDLKQVMYHFGVHKKDTPPKPVNAHDALADARWNLALFKYLEEYGKLHGITSYITL
jgi:hypothetical protein